jgi:hypothetical protein
LSLLSSSFIDVSVSLVLSVSKASPPSLSFIHSFISHCIDLIQMWTSHVYIYHNK